MVSGKLVLCSLGPLGAAHHFCSDLKVSQPGAHSGGTGAADELLLLIKQQGQEEMKRYDWCGEQQPCAPWP